MSNKEEFYIRKEMIRRLVVESLMFNTPANHIDLLSISKYKKYLNPEIYTSYENYLIEYTKHNIKQNFGISFLEFINMYIIDIIPMIRVSKRINEEKASSMSDLNKQVEVLKGEIDE